MVLLLLDSTVVTPLSILPNFASSYPVCPSHSLGKRTSPGSARCSCVAAVVESKVKSAQTSCRSAVLCSVVSRCEKSTTKRAVLQNRRLIGNGWCSNPKTHGYALLMRMRQRRRQVDQRTIYCKPLAQVFAPPFSPLFDRNDAFSSTRAAPFSL